jgi:hypothetical protein
MLSSSQTAALGRLACQGWRCCQREFAAAAAGAASTAKSTYNVPEGHHSSDLSSAACHIGLGRRRDITMRQDLRLYDADGKALTLADVFHVSGCVVWWVLGGDGCVSQL